MAALARTAIATLTLAAAVLGGFFALKYDAKQRQIEELNALTEQLREKVAEREAMLARLSRARRVAHLEVTEQRGEGDALETDLLFIELDDDGGELGRQEFTVPGDVVYVDAWTIKFDSEDVAVGHPLRGNTLILLRRVYTDRLPPRDGPTIDTPGGVPPAYAVGEPANYERKLWSHFWDIATDASLAEAMGVRVAQGESVYKPMSSGERYELVVDAAGGISLVPIPAESASGGTAEAASGEGDEAG